jgi:hypothetical protein
MRKVPSISGYEIRIKLSLVDSATFSVQTKYIDIVL